MKKSLLVISVILLIAGLFISCNSEAAESSSDLAYVKFADDSKALDSSITPWSGGSPNVNGLVWYYQATHDSGLGTHGATDPDTWTRINNTTGYGGQFGPFSLGSWKFAIIGCEGTDTPSATYTEGADQPWSDLSPNVKYYGLSGTSATAVTPVAIKRGTNTINVTIHSTVVPPNSLTLTWNVDYNAPDATYNGGKVYYNVTVGSTLYEGNYTITSQKANMRETEGKSVDVTTEFVAVTVTFDVYADAGKTADYKLSTGSISFPALKGSTVNITGSIDDLGYEYAEIGTATPDSPSYVTPTIDANDVAYVIHSSTITGYDTLEAAILAADAESVDTIGLLKDVDITLNGKTKTNGLINDFFINKSLNIVGNGHTINASYTYENGTPTKQTMNTAFLYVDGNVTVNMSNLTINSTGSSYAVVYDDGAVGTFTNVTINGDNICASAASTSSSLTVNGGSLNFTKASTTRPDYNPEDCVPVAAQYGGEVVLNGTTLTGTNGGAISVWPSGGSVTANNCAIDSTVFTTLAWICNGNAKTPANSIINLNSCSITGGTTPGDSGLSQHNAKRNDTTDTCGHYAEVYVNNEKVASCYPHEN